MPEHHILSPSSAHRWSICTPSAKLESYFPDSQSESAAEGTFAHKWAETELKKFLGRDVKATQQKLKKNPFWSRGLTGYVDDYVSEVIQKYLEAQEKDPAAKLLLEQKLQMNEWVPGGFGYGDAVIISDKVLEVIDLKYGRSVVVSAAGNPQLRLYALGAYQELSSVYDFDTVTMTIIQPRNGGKSSETLPLKELLEWGEKLKPIAQTALKGGGEFKPGEHCRFCRASVRCKALAEFELEIAKKQFDDLALLSDTEISEILGKADSLVSWANSIKDYALEEAVSKGKKWPGWKLVEGRSNRKLSSMDEAVQILLRAGYKEDDFMKPREIKGFTDLEKAMGKKKMLELLEGVIIKPPGKPKLAPESDKRPEWNSAETDFDVIQ